MLSAQCKHKHCIVQHKYALGLCTCMCKYCAAQGCASIVQHKDVKVLCSTRMCRYCAAQGCAGIVQHRYVQVLCSTSMCKYCAAHGCARIVQHRYVQVLCSTRMCKYCAAQGCARIVQHRYVHVLCSTGMCKYCAAQVYARGHALFKARSFGWAVYACTHTCIRMHLHLYTHARTPVYACISHIVA